MADWRSTAAAQGARQTYAARPRCTGRRGWRALPPPAASSGQPLPEVLPAQMSNPSGRRWPGQPRASASMRGAGTSAEVGRWCRARFLLAKLALHAEVHWRGARPLAVARRAEASAEVRCCCPCPQPTPWLAAIRPGQCSMHAALRCRPAAGWPPRPPTGRARAGTLEPASTHAGGGPPSLVPLLLVITGYLP